MTKGKRGEHLPPPSAWRVRAVDRQAADGWHELARQAGGNLRRAWIALTEDPRSGANPSRQHRLKGRLAEKSVEGVVCELWQYEITGAGRLWYAIDDAAKTLWIVHAGPGHPKATD
ncbi:hypothetical protein [Actinomadura parmotrematis]|uniref:Type II toxin-antitoxin system RelE/ParE family toxin n=1 Tax=Actinomadura parmotrematis TaxID=2864039 RepID=A0ABS7G5B1_9ACTN|nr:hypothetical protein [Actinomadura parmotrematis]MBW8487555.1 hypothetical protein [Actinomadura parmotrematis]